MDVVPREKSQFTQIVLGLIANFTSLAPSMSLGFSAIALPWLLAQNNPYRLSESQASWVASIASIATPIGGLISGPVSDRYGRRMALISVNVACATGWVVIAVAYYVKEQQYPLMLFGRVLTGLSTGLSSMPAAVYMAEVSTPQLRGMFITWNAMSFALGVLIVYMFGWAFKDNWGTTAIFCAAFPCIGLLGILVYLVESPSWLVSKNRMEDARNNMCKLYNTKDYTNKIQDEVETLMTSSQRLNITIKNHLSIQDFKKPTFVKPLLLITTFFFFQQFSGVFVIVFYAVDIVNEVKITMDPYLAICLIASMRVIGSVIVSVLSKRFGRRPLSLVSGAGMTLSMIAIAAYLILLEQNEIAPLPWLSLSLLMVYFFVSTLGFLTMPFGMAAEVFPAKIRGMSTGLTTCIAYIFNFIIVKIYPDMVRTMGNYKLFLFYGCVALVGTIFIAVFLPETKDKTLKEIEQYFDKKKKNTEDKSGMI